jgi:hypothetical protein
VSTSFASDGVKKMSRENVAACILATLANAPATPGRALDLVDGDQPIKELFR